MKHAPRAIWAGTVIAILLGAATTIEMAKPIFRLSLGTHTMTITDQIDAFIAAQNANRGTHGINLDFSALSASVPAGDNAVTGIAQIVSLVVAATGGPAPDLHPQPFG